MPQVGSTQRSKGLQRKGPVLIERVENTLSDYFRRPKNAKIAPKCGFEPKFSALGPNFSHARMARGTMPPPCGALENLTPNAYLHSSFYLRRIADPKNRSRLTRHDFAYVIFPRVPQRAPLSDRLVSTPHFGASPLIYHPCQCRASAAAPGSVCSGSRVAWSRAALRQWSARVGWWHRPPATVAAQPAPHRARAANFVRLTHARRSSSRNRSEFQK